MNNDGKEDLFKIVLNNTEIVVDINDSPYGKYIWESIANGEYEPDTFYFLDKNLNLETLLIDIGASDGPVTFFAATKGAKVFAYEPMPKIYRSLEKNLSLNQNLKKSIFSFKSAVSSGKSTIALENKHNKEILSPIVFTHQPDDQALVNVESIIDVISSARSKFPTKKILIKIDIEGAEWAILKDRYSIDSFADNKVKILAALHPGFHRPPFMPMKFLNRLFWMIWRHKNRKDSKQVFRNLNRAAKIYRTNLNLVTDENQFINLVDHGYHEWIIDFSWQEDGK